MKNYTDCATLFKYSVIDYIVKIQIIMNILCAISLY